MALIKRLKEKLINAALILLVVGVFLTVLVIAYRGMLRLSDDILSVRTAYDIIISTDALFSDLQDAETGQRGYVITGEDTFLAPYTTALSDIDTDFQALQGLIQDPAQQDRLASLKPLIDQKLTGLANSIAVRKENGFAAAQEGVLTEVGKNIMDSIRETVTDMQTAESVLLEARMNDRQQTVSNIQTTLMWGSLIGLIFYLLANYIISKYVMGVLVEKPLLEREHRALEDALKANKEMEAFSYSVSHDLRAPLRAIDGFTQILVEDYGSKLDDEGRRIATIIRASTVQMGKLIDDLLSFSRLGRQEVVKGAVSMKTLVDEVYQELKKTTSARDIAFTMGELPDARADINMMRVVWTNLLSNATKFTSKKEKATIEVGSTSDERNVTYYVKDNGAGFDMKYIDKLFGVFQRLHSVEDFEGTGVGLANVKRVIERHDGTVRAESIIGEGATFYFTLPK